MVEKQQGKLIILTGPSGAGKDEVMKKLLDRPNFDRIVTCTSRPIRPGEKNGKDYHFMTRQEFESMVAAGQLFEYVEYAGDYKGTKTKDILSPLSENRNVVWRIDPSRAAVITQTISETLDREMAEQLLARTLVIYLGVPSLFTLLDRQRRRRGSDPQEILKRIREDWGEWQNNKLRFMHVVVNQENRLDQTIAEVMGIIANGA